MRSILSFPSITYIIFWFAKTLFICYSRIQKLPAFCFSVNAIQPFCVPRRLLTSVCRASQRLEQSLHADDSPVAHIPIPTDTRASVCVCFPDLFISTSSIFKEQRGFDVQILVQVRVLSSPILLGYILSKVCKGF